MDDHLSQLEALVKTNTEANNQLICQQIEPIEMSTLLSPYGETLLHWAAADNNSFMCQYLITQKNIHVNQQNQRGATPLYYACLKHAVQSANVLLDHQANPVIRSGFSGQMPYEITTDDGLRERMLTFKKKYIPICYERESPHYLKVEPNFTMYDSYRYRRYMTCLAILNQKIHQSADMDSGSLPVIPELELIHQQQGIRGLIDHVQDLYMDYLQLIDSYAGGKHVVPYRCLACGSQAPDLKRCSKCHVIYLCGRECQKKIHLWHAFDC